MSHFRYATLFWEDNPNSDDPLAIQFRGEQAYRRSFFGTPGVGEIINVGTLNFGDGSSESLYLEITVADSQADVIQGRLVDAGGDLINYIYTSPGNYTAFFENFARISTLQNSSDSDYRTETTVTIDGGGTNGPSNLPPFSSLPSIVTVPDDANFSFQIPFVDPNGDNVTFRLATTVESGIVPFPNGLVVSSSGLLSWQNVATPDFTVVGDLWTTQVIMEDSVGASSPIDFILEIVDPSTVNEAPLISFDPAGPLSSQVGQQLSFTVTADDPDDDDIASLVPLNPPPGMTFVPNPIIPNDPATITVNWTPTISQAEQSFVIQFQATDSRGAQNLPSSITITPFVNENPIIINPETNPATISILEGQTNVIDIGTTDDLDIEGEGLIYSLAGADEELFAINSFGILTFINPPDFENPGDSDDDNNYEVQVIVTDSGGLTDDQDLTVTVADLNEDLGSLDLIQPDPDIAATFIGPTGISTDGLGTSDSGLLQADIPAGSTIEAAYLHVATRTFDVSFQPDTISFDDQLVDITWLENVGDASVLNFETGRADVTSIVSDRVGLGGGLFDFAVGETTTGQPEFIEGTSLSVIYSNPSLPERSIFLLEGGLTGPTPQTNTVFLADPIDKSDPDFIAQLALGIQFGFVRGTLPDLQFSEVDINGVRLTSSAGDFDDGSASNGALITVGGVGDSLDNPIDPFDNLASDDELYDLTDFLNDGDSSIQIDTANPSNDDSIFLVALTLPGNATILPNEAPTIIIPDTTPATVSIPTGQSDVIDIETTDDLDIEGEGLTYSLTGLDALLFNLDNETGELTFVNTPDFENPEDADGDNNYEVQVTVTDSGGLSDLVDLTVNVDQNDPPIIISPDTANILENTTLVIDVMSLDDNDSEGLGLTYSIIGGADSALFNIDPITGIVDFDTAPDFENPLDINTDNNYELEIEVADSQGLSATQVLTVTVTDNLPPDAVDNIYTLNGEPSIGGNLISDNTGDGVDSDPEGDLFTVTANSEPLAGSVSIDADGSFTYTPDLDEFSDSDSFTYTITDSDGGTDTANVTINDFNTEPIANDDEDTTDEDTAVTTAVLDNDSDPDEDLLTVTSATDGGNGTTTINADGSITYTPEEDFNGIDTYSYTIADGNGGTATANVEITVESINDDPIANDDEDTTDEDTAVTTAVLDNDSDPDEDSLTVTSATDAGNGTTTVNADGTITYTPEEDFNGIDTYSYTIADGNGGTATANVEITVESINDDPIAVDDEDTTDEDTAVTTAVLDNDSDPDEDSLTVTSATDGGNGTTTVNADGTITYTPEEDFNGTDTYSYTIDDGNGGTATANVEITVGSVNDDPIANDDADTTDENTPATTAVLDNDSDPDEDSLTVTSATDGANGTTVVNADNSITYTPEEDFSGTDTYSYTIADGNGGTATANVEITVESINDDPIANDDADTTDENTPATTAVLDNDSDPDEDSLTVTSATDGANGTTAVNADGSITYTPEEDFSGIDTYSYTIDDGNGGTDTAIVTITVENLPPDAVDNSYETSGATPVSGNLITDDTGEISPITGLGVDSDPEDDTLNVLEFTDPGAGTVVVEDDGSFTYTPNEGFAGVDSFTYTIDDGNGGTDTAIITITVENLPPDAVDNSYETSGATPVSGNLITDDTGEGLDSDPEDDTLTVLEFTDPGDGTVVVEDDGSFTYTPNEGFAGVDSFTYTIDDGNGGTDTAIVTITVENLPPDAVDNSYETSGATPVSGNLITDDTGEGLDSDPEDDTLTVLEFTDPGDGTVVVEDDGSFTYTPNEGFAEVDSFTYTIDDGNGGTDTAIVTITVENLLPEVVDDLATTEEDTPVTIAVLANDSDPDGDPLTVIAATDGANGTTVVNADGTITFTPDEDFSGTDTFTSTIDDGNGGTVTAEVTVTVVPVNDEPIAVDDLTITGEDIPVTTEEDTSITIAVLANDSDPDGDPLTVIAATDGANGTTVVNADGTITFTPDEDFSGTDTFTYTIDDGNGGTAVAEVTVTVTPVNDEPIAVDDLATTEEDTPVTIAVLANDSDPDGDPLTIIAATDGANGTTVVNADGTITFTPDEDFSGTDTFTYTIDDGSGDTAVAEVIVTVTPVNDEPIALDDSDITDEDLAVTTAVLANDSDLDEDPLTVTSATDGTNGTTTINADGTITYTPNPDFNGTDTYTYTIDDGNGGTATATVEITVNSVNDEPIALDDSDITDEDLAVTTAVLANDSDLDEDPLTVTSATDGTNGTTTVNADGTITYTPNPDFNGTDTYTYTIDDGNGGNAPATVAITVNSVNDIPNFTPGDTQNILEDAGAQNLAWAIGPSPGPENEAGQALNFLVENDNPALFAVVPTIAPDGTLTYTPIDDTSGTANVTVTLTDDGGTENGGIDTTGPIPFVINIEPVNDAPGFTAGPDQIVLEDAGAQNITGWATAIFPGPVDEAEQALNFLVENDNPALFAVVPTIAPDGTLTYTPTDDTNGIANVIVTLIDDGGTDNGGVDSSAPVPFVINVTEVNDAPSFIPGPDQIIPEDSGVQSLVWATAISPGPEDEAEQALNFIVSNDNPALFSVEPAIAPDGTLTYGTVDNANGIANVIVTLIDNGDTINGGINTSDSVPFVINVTEVNDAPVINDDSLTTDEDIPVNIVAIANDIDIDGNLNPTSTTVVSPATNGTVVNNGDGTFTYIPNPNYNGFDSFTYQITDAGGLTDIATVGITVNSVNDFPIANDENVTTDEDVPVNIAAIANDIDVDGNLVPTSATIIAQATNGTVVNNGDGTFTYTPNPDYNGLDSFAYQISDAGGLTDIATIGINIIPIEDSIIPNLITEPLNTVGGTGGNDALTGTTDSELLAGFAGNDVLDGRAGNDILDGGPNIDTAVYQSDSAGVNVNLNTGIVNGGFGGTDTLISIENIIGSEFDDNILGNAESNSLTGRNGNDTINGGDGNDFLVGSAGADILNGGAGNDSFIYLSPTEGNDTIEQFATGVDEILIVGALFPGGLSGGVLPLSQFFGGTIATDDNHRFGYDAATGRVLFDQDGEGGQGAQVLATLTGSQGLVNTDIKVL